MRINILINFWLKWFLVSGLGVVRIGKGYKRLRYFMDKFFFRRDYEVIIRVIV